jgi:transposase-like protein
MEYRSDSFTIPIAPIWVVKPGSADRVTNGVTNSNLISCSGRRRSGWFKVDHGQAGVLDPEASGADRHRGGRAYLKLEELRWNGHPVCPHFGAKDSAWYIRPLNGSSRATRTGSMSQRRVWKCGACRKQFSVLTGTLFQGSKIPVRMWLLVIFEMCAAKNGVSAREIERKYELTAKTAWFMLHRIREAMKREPLAGLLRGTVVFDETYIAGSPKNRHRNDLREQPRAYGSTDKTPVVSLIHYETCEVRSRVVPTITGQTLARAIAEQVDRPRTELWTDSARRTWTVGPSMRGHQTMDHAAGEYVRKAPRAASRPTWPKDSSPSSSGPSTASTTACPRPTCSATLTSSTSCTRCPRRPTRRGCAR